MSANMNTRSNANKASTSAGVSAAENRPRKRKVGSNVRNRENAEEIRQKRELKRHASPDNELADELDAQEPPPTRKSEIKYRAIRKGSRQDYSKKKRPSFDRENSDEWKRKSPEEIPRMLVTLRFLAKGDFLSETGDLHGIHKSSASRVLHRCCKAICNALQIRYPNTRDERAQRKLQFFRTSGFPNVVGAVDGTLIPIQAPVGPEEPAYICRKGFHAINVQAVCDSQLRFIDIIVKWPGGTHDAFIMSQSSISRTLEQTDDGWLLGDSGYALKPWLMTPIMHPSNQKEEAYNHAHSQTRNAVERAFGVLKARFRCLHKTGGCLQFNERKCLRIIEACMKLHNYAINNKLPAPANLPQNNADNAIAPQAANRSGMAIRRTLVQRF